MTVYSPEVYRGVLPRSVNEGAETTIKGHKRTWMTRAAGFTLLGTGGNAAGHTHPNRGRQDEVLDGR